MQPAASPAPERQDPKPLTEELDRIYESIAQRGLEVFKNGEDAEHGLSNWLGRPGGLSHPVRLQLVESEAYFTVRADVSGYHPDDLEMSLETRCLYLKIAGNRQTGARKRGKGGRGDHRDDQLLRKIEFPKDVDADRAIATLKDGILSVHLPKVPLAKPVRIQRKTT